MSDYDYLSSHLLAFRVFCLLIFVQKVPGSHDVMNFKSIFVERRSADYFFADCSFNQSQQLLLLFSSSLTAHHMSEDSSRCSAERLIYSNCCDR